MDRGGDILKSSESRKGNSYPFKIFRSTKLLFSLDQFLVNKANCPDTGAFFRYSREVNLFITGYIYTCMYCKTENFFGVRIDLGKAFLFFEILFAS